MRQFYLMRDLDGYYWLCADMPESVGIPPFNRVCLEKFMDGFEASLDKGDVVRLSFEECEGRANLVS